MTNCVLGIDIGGSHITTGLVDMDTKGIVPGSFTRKKVNRYAEANEILTVWADVISKMEALYPGIFFRIGFAMPGPFDYEKGICLIKGFDKYEALYGMNIREELAARTNIRAENICFRNDAEAFLEGEIFCGAGRNFQHLIGITLGTGLGSAVSHNGITTDAALSVMEYQGEKIEEFISTRGLVRIFKELTGETANDVLAIAELCKTDSRAKEAFKIFAYHLSWFLQKFIMDELPEAVIIGGNIAKAYPLFRDELINNLAASGVQLPQIILSSLGENALLIGGACKFILPLKIEL